MTLTQEQYDALISLIHNTPDFVAHPEQLSEALKVIARILTDNAEVVL